MRFLPVFALASGALALATGPVQQTADQQTVQGDELLNPENAVLATPEITLRDDTVSSSELEKRNPSTQATIRFPAEANPRPVVIAGITITFTMGYRWVKQAGKNVVQYYVKHLLFANGNPGRTAVQAIANGATFFSMRMAQNVQRPEDPPAGVNAFTLFVTDVHDEL
ncbi:hypothetical protein E4U58_001412 [Claviceps cyperi]|nr:hypothetical protein E4U58_001412 [Claviceps cyperi]